MTLSEELSAASAAARSSYDALLSDVSAAWIVQGVLLGAVVVWGVFHLATRDDDDEEDEVAPPLVAHRGRGLPGLATTKTKTTSSKTTSSKKQPAPPKSLAGQIASSKVSAITDAATGKDGDGITWKEIAANAFAVLAMGTSATAMVVEGSHIVNVAGVVCSLLGPAAAVQQHKISKLEGMRRLQNKLREDVNKLQLENDRLSGENKRLEVSTKKLHETEAALAEISKIQGKNVDVMVAQLAEYKQVQAEIKQNLEAAVIQNLISVVVRSDSDGDFIIDPEEVDGLMLRLHNINGVDFNEKNFRKAIKGNGGSLGLKEVMGITQNLLDDTVEDRDNIFVIKEKDLLGKGGKKNGATTTKKTGTAVAAKVSSSKKR